MTARPMWWWIERGLLLAATLAMVLGAGASSGRMLFVVAGVGSALLVVLAWDRDEVSVREVVIVAVLLRLIAFPLLPGLSDDGFRYLWDGLLQIEGINPYAFRPSDLELSGFHDLPLFERLNSTDYYSVYPPASQFVFLLGGMFGWPLGWYVLKAAFVGLEMAGVWALVRMAAPRWAVLYAWHPLAVIEVAGQGHTEAGMVGMLLLALLAYRRQRPGWAVAALTVASWFKLYPLVLVPFLLQRVGWRFAWVVAAVSLGLCAPYVHPEALAHVAESLDLYVRRFEFYAGPYYAIKGLGELLTGEDVSKTLGPVLRTVFVLGLAALFLLDRSRRFALPAVWLGVFALLWATATTVHPWYLLGPLALVPLATSSDRAGRLHMAAWHVLALGALGTYLFYTHGEAAYWPAMWAGWLGWATMLGLMPFNPLLQIKLQNRAVYKWSWLAPHVLPTARILDLGAGEGYVGVRAQEETGRKVVLADVADFNRTGLALIRYDGHRLPFATDAFGTTLLVFVLHHSEDPEAVLREAHRVTSGRVLVIESVFKGTWDRRWLELADRLANRLRSEGAMREQEGFLRFRSAAAWRRAFEAAGFRVVAEEQRGGWWHRQRLFVLEV